MQINKVSVDGELDLFGGRALIVHTNEGIFKTPSRTITSSEFNYKSQISHEPRIDNDISEIVALFNEKDWNKFMNEKGPFNSRLKTMEYFTDKMKHGIKRYYPQISPKVPLDISDIKQLITLQSMCADLDLISIPSLPPTFNNFDKVAEECAEIARSERKEPLMYLDMRLDVATFKKRFFKLLELSESDQIHTIGLIYRSFRENSPNYKLLWENRDSKVFLQMSQIPREITKTSTMHLLQKFGIDSFSVEMHKPPFLGGKQESESRPSGLTRRLDPDPLLFRPFKEWLDIHQELNCDCPICRNKSADEFMEIYTGQPERYPGQMFGAANRLHECYRSLGEFRQSRNYIRTGELKEYFKNKEGLNASDIHITPSPRSIFDFK